MWHVSSRSGVATLRTAIHLLLTYLLTYLPVVLAVVLGAAGQREHVRGGDAQRESADSSSQGASRAVQRVPAHGLSARRTLRMLLAR